MADLNINMTRKCGYKFYMDKKNKTQMKKLMDMHKKICGICRDEDDNKVKAGINYINSNLATRYDNRFMAKATNGDIDPVFI